MSVLTKSITIPKRLTRIAQVVREGEQGGGFISISSDEPYLRSQYVGNGEWEDYYEVLDHSPGAIDEERLKAGLPILFNHNRDQNLANAKQYNNDGKKISLPFDKFVWASGEFAENKKADVDSGALPHTSVGYEITGDGICTGALRGVPVYKFPWKPYEGSVVTIPADSTVGTGRQMRHKGESDETVEIVIKQIDDSQNSDKTKTKEQPNQTPSNMKLTERAKKHFFEADGKGGGGQGPTDVELKQAGKDALRAHRERCKEIDDFVAALEKKSPAWATAARAVADKFKAQDEPDYQRFVTEANLAFVSPGQVDADETESESQRFSGETNLNIYVPGQSRGGAPRLSVGAQFVKAGAKRGGSLRGFGFTTDCRTLGIRGKVDMAARAGFTSSDLSAINVAPMQQLIQLGVQRITIMDLIAPGTTGAAAIPYPKENSLGSVGGNAVAAGAVPRVGTTAERGRKPKWEPDLSTDTAIVQKVAVTTPVPEEFLSDFPGFQSYIDERLPWMVDIETEGQILYGDGVGTNLKGIVTNPIQSRPYATDWATTIQKAITDVRVGSFFEPDGIVMHPYDWEAAKLEKDLNGQFLAGGPVFVPYGNGVMMMIQTYWGLPVVVTTSCLVGRPIVAAWKLGAQTFLREGMRVEVSNSNNDDFEKNMLTLRAEHRLALATYRPPAFLEVTGGPART